MKATYIGSILHEDHQPIHWDICKQPYGFEYHKWHSSHMDHTQGKDLNIEDQCKLDCRGIQDH